MTMPWRARGLALVLTWLLLGATCQPNLTVSTHTNPEADLSSYKTYAWLEREGMVELPAELDSSVADRVTREALGEALAERGLRRVEAPEAELLVGYFLAVDTEASLDEMEQFYLLSRAGGGAEWLTYSDEQALREFSRGMLVVDIFDGARAELLWRGRASDRLAIDDRQAVNTRKLKAAVRRLFTEYPSAGTPSP